MTTLDGYIADGLVANRRLLEFYLANGATSPNINDARLQFLAAQGFPNNEMGFYASKGYSGTLNERRFQFFRDGAPMFAEIYPTFSCNSTAFTKSTNLGAANGGKFYFAIKLRRTATVNMFGWYEPILAAVLAINSGSFVHSFYDSTAVYGDDLTDTGSLRGNITFPVNQSKLLEISCDRTQPAATRVRMWLNGASIYTGDWSIGAGGDIDWTAATAWELLGTYGFPNPATVRCGLLYMNFGVAPAAPIMTIPGVGENDPGIDGTFGGFLKAPEVFVSAYHQSLSDWNAGTNLGTAGTLTRVGPGFTA